MFPSIVQFSIIPSNLAVAHAVWKSNGIVNLQHDTEKYDCLESLDGERTQRLLRSEVPSSINEAAGLGAKVHAKIEDLKLLEEDLKKVLRGYAVEVRALVKVEHKKTLSIACFLPFFTRHCSSLEKSCGAMKGKFRSNAAAASCVTRHVQKLLILTYSEGPLDFTV